MERVRDDSMDGKLFLSTVGEYLGLASVSYTHLDVYKRQVMIRPVITYGRET